MKMKNIENLIKNIDKTTFLKNGMGLYGWVYKEELSEYTSIDDILCSTSIKVKYGQYGSKSDEGKNPIETTTTNLKGGVTKDAIVFVYYKDFTNINKNSGLQSIQIENTIKRELSKFRYNEGSSTEVFKVNPLSYESYVLKYLNIALKNKSDIYDNIKPPRWYQRLFSKIYNRVFNETKIFLLAFSCGKGKSLAIAHSLIDIYDKISGDIFLLTTKPSTLDQYANTSDETGVFFTKEIQEKYYIVTLREEINTQSFDYESLKKEASGRKIIFLSSKQFLDGLFKNFISEKFNQSFLEMIKNNVSLVISDEGHWGANSDISNQIHSIDDNFEIKSIFNKDVNILYSTATPGSILFKYNIDRKYQFYLNNEIEESFADFLNNPNENSLDNYIEISSNNSKDLKVILSEEVENICTEYYC